MNSDIICNFCEKEFLSRNLYVCPRCNVRYCSISCYKHFNHQTCSELFYRDWVRIEATDDGNRIFDDISKRDKDEGVFKNKSTVDSEILEISKKDISKMDEMRLNEELQALGIMDPNDIEELLNSLKDEEKEQFFKLVSDDNFDSSFASHSNAVPSIFTNVNLDSDPWWIRCSGLVVEEKLLVQELPSDHIYLDIDRLLQKIFIPSRVSPTICFDIINALAAYCLVIRESIVSNFWSRIDNLKDEEIIRLGERLRHSSGCLSNGETYSSFTMAMGSMFYKASPDPKLRDLLKSDVFIICKNYDWRSGGKEFVEFGIKHFVVLALYDIFILLRKTKQLMKTIDQEEKKNWFGICKKMEFYLRWAAEKVNQRELFTFIGEH